MEIGFLTVSLWDLLDIALVGWLLYQSFRLLRGSVAVNIFIGVVTLIVLSWIFRALNMQMISAIMSQLISTGVIILIIVFQPEVRRFLLLLGNNTLRQRSNLLDRLLDRQESEKDITDQTNALTSALLNMGKLKQGALIILTKNAAVQGIADTGVRLNAVFSRSLIENIFFKNSPLHDGAMLLNRDEIIAAGCVLPLSDSGNLPRSVGLRHRAAVGITERTEVAAFIVSEETGTISFAISGKLERRLSKEKIYDLIRTHL